MIAALLLAAATTASAAPAKEERLPAWTAEIKAQSWPYLAISDDRAALLFAKTAGEEPGSTYPRVLVRHEFNAPQTDANLVVAGKASPARSEQVVEEIDCVSGRFRALRETRYADNNLGAAATDFSIQNRAWTPPEPDSFDQVVLRAACSAPHAQTARE